MTDVPDQRSVLPPKLAALYGEYEWPVVTVLMHEREHQGQIRKLLARLRG
jgi:hypothetical protein